eukprot:scaffold31724_cov59-Phaeocystis_antarctica.AAC.3
MASPSSEANGVAPSSEDNGAALSHSETPPPHRETTGETPRPRYVFGETPPPRYVFGFSTGHVGTTSLSSRRSSTGGAPHAPNGRLVAPVRHA